MSKLYLTHAKMGVPHDNAESRSQQRTTEAHPFRTWPHQYVQDYIADMFIILRNQTHKEVLK